MEDVRCGNQRTPKGIGMSFPADSVISLTTLRERGKHQYLSREIMDGLFSKIFFALQGFHKI